MKVYLLSVVEHFNEVLEVLDANEENEVYGVLEDAINKANDLLSKFKSEGYKINLEYRTENAVFGCDLTDHINRGYEYFEGIELIGKTKDVGIYIEEKTVQ